jgi:hypothetical protein
MLQASHDAMVFRTRLDKRPPDNEPSVHSFDVDGVCLSDINAKFKAFYFITWLEIASLVSQMAVCGSVPKSPVHRRIQDGGTWW